MDEQPNEKGLFSDEAGLIFWKSVTITTTILVVLLTLVYVGGGAAG
jgi:hypothetical protein